MSQPLAYIYSPVFLKHNPGGGHLERPDRLSAIESHLKEKDLWSKLQHYNPEAIKNNELFLVHDKQLVEYNIAQKGKSYFVLDAGDTVLSKHSIDAALQAAGSGTMAADLIFKEKKHNRVFAAVRPPGHHAEYKRSMGFCVFNNIAVAAAYAIEKNYIENALIIDWDVHHGNGTQNIFYNRSDVFYLSIHQSPFYPYTGAAAETGVDTGDGYTLNIPLQAGQNDEVYLQVLQEALKKIEKKFSPDLLLVSAGFDAHRDDLLGQMRVSEDGFGKMTKIISAFAEKHCQGNIISMLEGGYDLSGLSSSVYEHLKSLEA
jgi:acetoin utilization deacetylase AcuC-like enzyme